MSKRIVISLGGNALGYTPEEQKRNIAIAAEVITDIIQKGYDVVITHGNGPQVGLIHNAFAYAHQDHELPSMPFPESVAMSEGYIGYHLQQAILSKLRYRQIHKECISVLSEVVVDKEDPAFENPSKPIGTFYTKEEAERWSAETGDIYKEDAGRGYRRVVPSPRPIDILEKHTIENLLNHDVAVITCGGGGIPVVNEEHTYKGVPAVIDKDRTSALLAVFLNADYFLIVTAVDKVSINFRKENQQELSQVSVSEMEKYMQEGHFAKGSMYEKVEACVEFLKKCEDSTAVITTLQHANLALIGLEGTQIRNR